MCGGKLGVSKLCVDKLCGDKLCVVCGAAGAGRTRAGRGQDVGRRKKQEPLTKMWGIKP